MAPVTCLIPQLQQPSTWLFLKIPQDCVFSIEQSAFSCGLANPESTILYHKVMQKVWEDGEFLLLEKQCTFFLLWAWFWFVFFKHIPLFVIMYIMNVIKKLWSTLL